MPFFPLHARRSRAAEKELLHDLARDAIGNQMATGKLCVVLAKQKKVYTAMSRQIADRDEGAMGC